MDTKKSHEVKSAASPAASDVGVGTHEHHKVSLGKKILYHLWDSDQHLKSPQERALVRKLDFGILICATLGWVSDPCAFMSWPDLLIDGSASG